MIARKQRGLVFEAAALVAAALAISACYAPTPGRPAPSGPLPVTTPTWVGPTRVAPTPPSLLPSDTPPPSATPETAQPLAGPARDYAFTSRTDLQIDLGAVPPSDVKKEIALFKPWSITLPPPSYDNYPKCSDVHTAYSQPTVVEEASFLHERSLPPSVRPLPDVTACGYQENEPITVSLVNPSGEVMLRVEATAELTCTCDGTPTHCYPIHTISDFDFLPGDQLGEYSIEILSKNARLVHNFTLLGLAEPAVYYSARLGGYVVAGYGPFEAVRVLACKVSTFQPGQFVGESKLALDENGIGLLAGLKPEAQRTALSPAPVVLFVVRKNLDYVIVNNPNLGLSTGYRWILEPLDYGKIIELDPANAYAYYKRGVDYVEWAADDQAIADFNKAIELDPGVPDFYSSRGRAYIGQSNYEAALADCDRAIALAPEHADAYFYRGLVYQRQGHGKEAITDFERFLELGTDEVLRSQAEQRLQELKDKLDQ